MARLPYCFGAATGSSKPPRRSTGVKPPNEDRWAAQGIDGAELYGVFDGHGGEGAAEFVAKHLPELVRTKLLGQLATGGAARRKDAVSSVLTEAFLAVDSALYQQVRSQRVSAQAKGRGASSQCSRCRMYREKPCICTGVALPANVGSTGSLVHVRNSVAGGQATVAQQGAKALTALVCVSRSPMATLRAPASGTRRFCWSRKSLALSQTAQQRCAPPPVHHWKILRQSASASRGLAPTPRTICCSKQLRLHRSARVSRRGC